MIGRVIVGLSEQGTSSGKHECVRASLGGCQSVTVTERLDYHNHADEMTWLLAVPQWVGQL
jgi:hypothetical protein